METRTVKPLRILVVDDHRDTVEVVDRILKQEGHYVRTAEGFATALASARAERFEVLLCDIGMPDGDGCDLLGEIRALYSIRAIALTAYGMAADVKRMKDAGFDQLLLKPIDLADLYAALAFVAIQIKGEQIGLLNPVA